MRIIVIIFLVVIGTTIAFPSWAGMEMLTVTSGAAVGLSAATMQTNDNNDKECLVGPIVNNSIMVTFSSPVVVPTSSIGVLLTSGVSINIKKKGKTRDEVSNFRAIATGTTSIVPVTCN